MQDYRTMFRGCVICWFATFSWLSVTAENKEFPVLIIGKDKKSFRMVRQIDKQKFKNQTGEEFRPWGFNYDRDAKGRLLEDYWIDEWDKIERDFREMKAMGANVIRIHLQLAKFLDSPTTANKKSLEQLQKLLDLAKSQQLYLDITGLACYHKNQVPMWYDNLEESERWQAQAFFWKNIAKIGAKSPIVFCYDLMNEPVSPAGKRKERDWLGPPFGDKYYVQLIALDQKKRSRPHIAKLWASQLRKAIREEDDHHFITIGLVDWSLDRPGLTSGFVPDQILSEVDFMSVHLYPEKGKIVENLKTLKQFSLDKPLLLEETFPLKCSMDDFSQFMTESNKITTGTLGFYWGQSIEELRQSKKLGDQFQLHWLEYFVKHSAKNKKR